MATKKLDIEFSLEEWSILEIINPSREHQLAFHINKVFNTDLERDPNFDFYIDGKTEYFPMFTYTDEELKRLYILLCTHSENNVPIWKDFNSDHSKLFLIYGYNHKEVAKQLEGSVMEIPNTIYSQFFNFDESPKTKGKVSVSEKRKQRLEKLFREELLEALELHFFEKGRNEDSIKNLLRNPLKREEKQV